jgi:hypothetical protein
MGASFPTSKQGVEGRSCATVLPTVTARAGGRDGALNERFGLAFAQASAIVFLIPKDEPVNMATDPRYAVMRSLQGECSASRLLNN